MADFIMPNLGADMRAGTLVKWHVQPGAAVKRGDIIAEVETEKGIIDIECFETGTVERLITQPGSKIPVGEVMAVIHSVGSTGGVLPERSSSTTTPIPAETPRVHASPLARKIAVELGIDLSNIKGTGPGGLIHREDVEAASAAKTEARTKAPHPRVLASPLARRRAGELGIDLSTIKGTGPEGAVEVGDIERVLAQQSQAPAKETAEKGLQGMRHAIAAAMAKSNREIPHYFLGSRIDMSATLKWLDEENRKRSLKDRLLPAVMFLKVVALALRDVPALNGFWIEDGPRISKAVHIGFAIAMKGGGLIAPAVHDVDQKSCDEIMAVLRDLIPRARSGRLRSSEMTDATITVTSLGDLGVETVFGVIYPPQVALVGFGKIMDQPWAQNGMLGVHPVMTASLAGDHRATDGHQGAQFLESLNRHFQTPEAI
jgi:pyruvate dehydrogenase E2 component (dihydrolipoamide acetyltransferase)